MSGKREKCININVGKNNGNNKSKGIFIENETFNDSKDWNTRNQWKIG